MKWRAKEKGVYGFLIVEGKMIYFVGASQMEFGFLNSRFKVSQILKIERRKGFLDFSQWKGKGYVL